MNLQGGTKCFMSVYTTFKKRVWSRQTSDASRGTAARAPFWRWICVYICACACVCTFICLTLCICLCVCFFSINPRHPSTAFSFILAALLCMRVRVSGCVFMSFFYVARHIGTATSLISMALLYLCVYDCLVVSFLLLLVIRIRRPLFP